MQCEDAAVSSTIDSPFFGGIIFHNVMGRRKMKKKNSVVDKSNESMRYTTLRIERV